jgi:hypothetical protein
MIKYLDLILFFIFLINDFENIILYLSGSDKVVFFDLIFNLWFALFIVIIFRYFIFKDKPIKKIIIDFFTGKGNK